MWRNGLMGMWMGAVESGKHWKWHQTFNSKDGQQPSGTLDYTTFMNHLYVSVIKKYILFFKICINFTF